MIIPTDMKILPNAQIWSDHLTATMATRISLAKGYIFTEDGLSTNILLEMFVFSLTSFTDR